jgi:hypothetical protein
VKIRILTSVAVTATIHQTEAVATVSTLSAATATASPTSAPIVAADFASNACTAQWQGNDGVLPCPGQDGDPRGFVLPLQHANMEDGTSVDAPAVLAYPAAETDGYVLGLYPAFEVASGDHFRALVGCEQDATSCSALFRLSYLDESGAARDLWTLGEFYDGHYYNLDVDLSPLAGQQVRLVLSVNNLGDSTGDRALWVGPRIVRFAGGVSATATAPAPTASAVPTATRTPALTATAMPSATPAPDIETPEPKGPIPQFIDSIINFFRQLFGGTK